MGKISITENGQVIIMINKRIPVRSKKLLKAAEGQSCIRCGSEDGTIVAAHYSGYMSHRLGKGLGQKCDDTATAELCYNCHCEMDQYLKGNDPERAVEFLILILETINRRWYRGDFK